jgi:hypothetical protein
LVDEQGSVVARVIDSDVVRVFGQQFWDRAAAQAPVDDGQQFGDAGQFVSADRRR